jgi:hypothetical protein
MLTAAAVRAHSQLTILVDSADPEPGQEHLPPRKLSAPEQASGPQTGTLSSGQSCCGVPPAAVSLAEQARELNRRYNDWRCWRSRTETAALACAKAGQHGEALTLQAECQEILSELDRLWSADNHAYEQVKQRFERAEAVRTRREERLSQRQFAERAGMT